jgi:RNA polymerase-interacting CarD/CdnL/TRCF family regulator
MQNVLDQLQQATLTLTKADPIKDRLIDAYTRHLETIDARDIPERLRAQFVDLHAALHRERPLPRENVVRASVRKMSNDEAARHAAVVVQAFTALARASAPMVVQRKQRKLPSGAIINVSPIVKLFANDG